MWWNASPYHLGYKGKLQPEDLATGAKYLRDFVKLCSELRVVIAMGPPAHDVAAVAWAGSANELPPLILTPHPMIYGRGFAERQAELDAKLVQAARLIRRS